MLPLLVTLVLIAGCDLGPDYKDPATEIPAEWRATDATARAAWPSLQWWRGFGSPTLDALIAEAETRNFDIAAAVARVREADAAARIAGAPLLPTVSGQGSASWAQVSTSGRSSFASSSGVGRNRYTDIRQYGALGNASYEADFWGLNRAAFRAAEASAVASRFDQQVVALSVVTSVANAWFNALAFEDRLAVAQNNLRDSEQTLRVIQTRLQVGTASALDVAQQQALVEGVRASIPNLRNEAEQEIISLGILIGRPPQAVDVPRGTLTRLKLPPVYPGLPSALLGRRPDVAEAEAQLVSANANIKAARAAFFPTIALTGQGGFQSLALTTLFGPGATIGSLAASLTQPIFDGGRLRGQLEQSRARYDELVADYRKAVIQSFTDVENALAAYRFTTEQQALQQRAVDTAQRAADIARAQVAAGTVDITTVLQAQLTLYNDQDLLVQVRLARFIALLNLFKALGGGWERPGGAVIDQFPGLSPGLLSGGLALPVGDNLK
ncbi:MAG: efflux transporter outer membrane subunit [Acetobacteraceae bacterium]|nr:efflux transporter outer membrane subunit [Acetobacteraceae bacterium]